MNLRTVLNGTRLACWFAVTLLATGCAPGYGNVSGSVSYQGKPLTTGTIIFYDAGNGAPSAEIKPDGTYTVPHVRAGTAKVAIMMPMDIPFMGFGGSGGGKTPEPAKVPSLPPKFADPAQSGLTCQIKTGSNTCDLKLD
jgi:hypothetical protein